MAIRGNYMLKKKQILFLLRKGTESYCFCIRSLCRIRGTPAGLWCETDAAVALVAWMAWGGVHLTPRPLLVQIEHGLPDRDVASS
jgi:hypothetical protein